VFVAPTTPFVLRTPDNPDGVDRGIFDATEAALRRDVAAWCADSAPSFWGPKGGVLPGLEDWTIRQIVDPPLPVLLETMRVNVRADIRDELKAFDVPTLIVHGDADVSAPIELTGRRTAALLPDVELIEFPGIGHGIYLTEHERVAEAMIAFVGR
jgi:pimeloyl-ACP methyl ester carboxylesterase